MLKFESGKKNFIWATDGIYFQTPISFVMGMGQASHELTDEQDLDSAKLLDFDSRQSKLRLFRNEIPKDRKHVPCRNIIVLRTLDFELGMRVEHIVHLGDAEDFKDSLPSNAIVIDEDFIVRNGLKLDDCESKTDAASHLTEEVRSAMGSFLLFETETRSIAISVESVLKIAMPFEAETISLVSEKALGYFHIDQQAVPILSFENIAMDCERIIISKVDSYLFAFPVKRLSGLVRDIPIQLEADGRSFVKHDEKDWEIIDTSKISEGIDLKKIWQGYQHIYGLQRLNSDQKNTSRSKALIQIDFGEKVCVPIEIVISIELASSDFEWSKKEYSYQGLVIPFFDARAYYRIKSAKAQNSEKRVLILKKLDKLIAVGISSVDSIFYIDEQITKEYGSWILKEMTTEFQKDVRSLCHTEDYFNHTALNLMIINFDSLFSISCVAR